MTTCIYYRREGKFGWTYDLRAGERIPRHQHSWEMYHTIECLSGEVLVKAVGTADRVRPGESLLIDSGIPHEILALVDSKIVNLLLEGDAGMTYPDGHVALDP